MRSFGPLDDMAIGLIGGGALVAAIVAGAFMLANNLGPVQAEASCPCGVACECVDCQCGDDCRCGLNIEIREAIAADGFEEVGQGLYWHPSFGSVLQQPDGWFYLLGSGDKATLTEIESVSHLKRLLPL